MFGCHLLWDRYICPTDGEIRFGLTTAQQYETSSSTAAPVQYTGVVSGAPSVEVLTESNSIIIKIYSIWTVVSKGSGIDNKYRDTNNSWRAFARGLSTLIKIWNDLARRYAFNCARVKPYVFSKDRTSYFR